MRSKCDTDMAYRSLIARLGTRRRRVCLQSTAGNDRRSLVLGSDHQPAVAANSKLPNAMSSYSSLYVGSFCLGGDRGEINPLIMTLFRSTDKAVTAVRVRDLPSAADYDAYERDEEIQRVCYTCPVDVIADRLDLMGFTEGTARAAFQVGAEHTRKQVTAALDDMGVKYDDPVADAEYQRALAEERTVLAQLTADRWVAALRELRAMTVAGDLGCGPDSGYTPMQAYMLRDDMAWYGFPGLDIRHAIRLAIGACHPNESVTYDLSDLVHGGYYEATDDLVEQAESWLAMDFEASRGLLS